MKKLPLHSSEFSALSGRSNAEDAKDRRERRDLSIFQPRMVLLFSLSGAALIGLYLLRSPSVRATVFNPSATFQYFVPLMVPLIAFMFERVEHVRDANFFQHGVDYLVVGLALGRVIGNVPYISGHTLLLSYMLLQSKSWLVRISAILVLAQTLYLKYIVWCDFVTSNVGLVLGCTLALLVALSRKMQSSRTAKFSS